MLRNDERQLFINLDVRKANILEQLVDTVCQVRFRKVFSSPLFGHGVLARDRKVNIVRLDVCLRAIAKEMSVRSVQPTELFLLGCELPFW